MNKYDNQQIEEKFTKIEKDATSEKNFKPLSLTKLMAKKFKEMEWIVDGLVPNSGTTAVSGCPASYKTWIMLDLAIKVAMDGILFDRFSVSQTGVLIIDEESGERLLQKRMQKLCQNFDLPIYFLSFKDFKVFPEEQINTTIKLAKKKKIKLVIFDSLVRIHNNDENNANEMAKVFKALRVLNKNGLTVIFTHHNRKQGMFKGKASENMRGSSDILASVDSHLAIEKNSNDFIIINQTKSRYEKEISPFKVGIEDSEDKIKFEYLGDVDETETKKGEAKEFIKTILSESEIMLYKKQIIEQTKKMASEQKIFIGDSNITSAISEMIEKDEIYTSEGNQKNKIYCGLKDKKYKSISDTNLGF